MNPGFYIILLAQFLSALADNALLFTAIALLRDMEAPSWHDPLLQWFFVISYIILAPFVGSFADAFPKGRVMFVSNAIKFVGSTAMVFGMPPLFAYGIVGIGAAAYSPAKYGILTEYLPQEMLVKANGWMEGSTVMAIVLGTVIGAILPGINIQVAMIVITAFYMLAAIFNIYIPKVPIDHKLTKKNPIYLISDFWHSFKALWKDAQGRVSLAVTTLFWGVAATLRFVVLAWAGFALNFNQEQSTYMMVVVAIGIAFGSIAAARMIKLEESVKVLPVGIVVGVLVISMIFITNWILACVLLLLIGALSGYLVVPLNALLQHRGHQLIGAGHSIAVQNFNENLGIAALISIYTVMVKADIEINYIIVAFGLFVSISMSGIYKLYQAQKSSAKII
ncbi:lysophospholipid transporter LplT [Methylobacillus gramineus]|uniref:lysophospholipid transporter LplT n=1 Tax=Methylobacillus gramineus TaxID=755169 RepID=UPI001CFF84BD|nr:lysophospholipid transporter LplT [Methylobacillus gramineus]MCB5186164.1 lysophospholipid transporter LplT [Methylobacillus gramineus]